VLDSLITSKTRLKLLMKFFLNPGTSAYLRGLADEFRRIDELRARGAEPSLEGRVSRDGRG
jgi:hypothetical protein